MPFKSEKQRRYLHANEPELAKKWEKEYPGGPMKKQKDTAQQIRKSRSK